MKDIFSKPNQISIIRILLIPIFIMFLLMDIPYKNYIAAFIFIILSLSDALDGYIARKKQQITGIGKIIDPIADKLLISTALIFLILDGRIQLWMAIVIIMRELVITALRIFFLPKKVIISASYLGKIKTVSQIIAILAVILNIPFNWWLMLIAVIITVVSGLDYIIKMGSLLSEKVVNLPNIITTFRLLLIPLFIINILNLNLNFALIVFAVFVLSDKLDGISARMTEQVTKFGKVYDAYTDLIFLIIVLITYYIVGFLPLVWVIIIGITPLILPILNLIYFIKTKEIPSNTFGKIVVGGYYLATGAYLIDFTYTSVLLIIVVTLAYSYIIFDIYKIMTSKKTSTKSF